MAVQGEFPRARGAGVPKGTILCLGRVLDAHEEQDDSEGGHCDGGVDASDGRSGVAEGGGGGAR